ncbi:MAG: 4Fe-4S dicluster domain-containing protein [Planctomycetota bacterium]|nr:4Fe-4S dicluster domain-containing protein [Planctomycetota bacterium]
MQYGFVIDQRRCIGCHACTVACKSENDVPVGDFRTWVKYSEVGNFPQVKRHFAVLRCNQCSNAPCVTICPVTALHKRDDGIVDLDRDVCIGCKACMQACPYDALYLNEDSGSAEKCHFCAHRTEQGLAPACAVVCPEEAIIPGDFHDPNSKVSQLIREVDGAQVRRPEQGTRPNVWYLGAHSATIEPGTAAEPESWLWSDRRLPPPQFDPEDAERFQAPDTRVVLNSDHSIHWKWKVSAYLVTKGVAAGAAMWAPFAAFMPGGAFAQNYLPELLALIFTTLTTVLLVADLKRPTKFLSLVLRPNTKSWLVKGAWVLMAFSGLTTAVLLARFLEFDELANGLRWTNLVPASLAAAYTAFLFAQCEGRDLWQRTNVLLPHLLVQALAVGAITLLPFLPDPRLAVATFVLALAHHGLGLLERHGKHHTTNAQQAAALMHTVKAWPGSRFSALHLGLAGSTAAAILALFFVLGGTTTAAPLAVCALLFWGGLFLYEQAYVRAGQLPALS